MINCKNCGAPLSLGDAYCPHCGTPNPEAQEHLKKLNQLDRRMDAARMEVEEEVQKSRKGYGLLIVLVLLLFANLVFFVLHGAAYEISDKIISESISEEQIRQQLDTLMDEGEYIELAMYMDKYSLTYRDYNEYYSIANLANYYNRALESMTQYLYASDSYDDPLIRVCSNILDYKEEYDQMKKREDSEKTLYHIERLNDEVNGFLKAYLKLTEEDIAGIKDMTGSALVILVNERLTNED